MCDDDKIKELKNFFLKIDKDGNGTKSRTRIKTVTQTYFRKYFDVFVFVFEVL